MAKLTYDNILEALSSDALKYFFPGLILEERPAAFFGMAMPKRSRAAARDFFVEADLPTPSVLEAAAEVDEIDIAASPDEFYKDEDGILRKEDEEAEARKRALLKEIEALQEKYGVSIKELEVILSYKLKFSRLRITRHHKIILDDFDRLEVKMDKLTKAVFLLYLRHPEGIRFKELCDHRKELEDIYLSISGRSDLEGIQKSIDDLTDSISSNSINEKVSKVKKAFRNVIDDRVAMAYYINGSAGAAKSIALDRSLVIWE